MFKKFLLVRLIEPFLEKGHYTISRGLIMCSCYWLIYNQQFQKLKLVKYIFFTCFTHKLVTYLGTYSTISLIVKKMISPQGIKKCWQAACNTYECALLTKSLCRLLWNILYVTFTTKHFKFISFFVLFVHNSKM